MDAVLTLIASPDADLDAQGRLGLLRRALENLGAETAPADWLSPGRACDIAFDGLSCDQADAAARTVLAQTGGPGGIDIIAQPQADRRKRLLVADMESTLIQQEMLDELADLVGLRERIAQITYRAMNGEIDFKEALRERVGLLAGLPVDALEQCYRRVTLMPGAEILTRTLLAHGVRCVLVSGGFRFFTARVRELLGFHEDQGNDLEISDGRLSGRAVEPILDKDAKHAALIRCAAAQHLPLRLTLAVGDGANDLPMLLAAGLGVAFRAKPAIAAEAHARIDHGDLTALLYLQGYRREEFVE